MIKSRKVVVIGDGAVGSTTAFSLMGGHAVKEIVIIDVNKEKVQGDVLDMVDGLSFLSVPKEIKAGDYPDCADAAVIIITAGAGQKPGETRLDLLKKNAKIMTSVCENLKPYLDPQAIVIIVSNPCDVLTRLAYNILGLPASQVFGSGTVLDTARLKSLISEGIHVDPRNVHTYIVGEHGDSEVAVWSATTVGGMSLLDYCSQTGQKANDLEHLHEKVKNAAYEIIARKGATNYAVALAVSKIVSTILNDQNSILTVSAYIQNGMGGAVDDVYLSLPCIVGREGVKRILHLQYTRPEQLAIIASAKALKDKFAELEA